MCFATLNIMGARGRISRSAWPLCEHSIDPQTRGHWIDHMVRSGPLRRNFVYMYATGTTHGLLYKTTVRMELQIIVRSRSVFLGDGPRWPRLFSLTFISYWRYTTVKLYYTCRGHVCKWVDFPDAMDWTPVMGLFNRPPQGWRG